MFDQYSYLHFASGIIAYFWNISIIFWFILHTIFEYLENTHLGIHFINKYITFWPGGKPYADPFINNIGDTITAILGWISAYYLDKIGHQNGWYKAHIKN